MKKSTTKLLALLLTLVLVVGLIPSTVLAIDEDASIEETVEAAAEDAVVVESEEAQEPSEEVAEEPEAIEEPVASEEPAISEEASEDEVLPVDEPSEEMTSSYKVISSVVNGSVIKVEGILPDDAVLNVKAVTYSDLVSLYNIDPDEDIAGDFVVAYDITILSQGYEYEPEDFGDTVSVSISAVSVNDSDEVIVSHVKDDATIEEVEEVSVENGEVSFEAESFSIYVVSVSGNVNVAPKYLKANESTTFSFNSGWDDIRNVSISCGTKGIVNVSAKEDSSLGDNYIKVTLSAIKDGSTSVTVKFDGKDFYQIKWRNNKSITFNVSIGKDGQVSYNLDNITSNKTSNKDIAVEMGNDFSCKLTPKTNYSLPETIEITMGGNPVAEDGYSYNYITGDLTVKNVINDVVIKAVAGPAFTANMDLKNHVKATGKTSDIKLHSTFTVALGLDGTYMSKFYDLPTSVEVTMGDAKLEADQYSYENGVVTVENVTGNITVKAAATLSTDESRYTKTVTMASNSTEPQLLSEAYFGKYFSGEKLTVEGGNGIADFTTKTEKKSDNLGFFEKHVAFVMNFFGHGKNVNTIEYVVPANIDVIGNYVFSYKYKTGVNLDIFDILPCFDFSKTKTVDVLVMVTAPEFTLTFNANYEDADPATAEQTVSYKTATTLNANSFTRTGYDFAGWSTTATGSVEYADGASYTLNTAADANLYAVWTLKDCPVTVNFELGKNVKGIEAPESIVSSLKYGTTYSVDTYGNVTYKDANNKTQTLIETQAIPGYVFSTSTVNKGTVGEDGVTVTVKINNMKSDLNYFVALEKAKVYDKDSKGNVNSHSKTLFTESLKNVTLDVDAFNAYVKDNYGKQVSNTHQYYLVGSQISDFFKSINNTVDPMSSDEAIAAINASTGKAAKIVEALGGKLDTKQYKVEWTVLKYESDGWHIDGMIVDRNMLTVTYVVDGETYATEYFDNGDKVEAIAKPTKEGYTFSGWFNEDGSDFTGLDKITSSIIVNGTFKANPVVPVTPLVINETPKEENIPDEDTPLAGEPETEDPSEPAGDPSEEIAEEPVALADAPSAVTGDTIIIWMLVVVFASLGIITVVIIDRKEKD